MKLCIVSDTHRNVQELYAAALLADDADVILHAGDETADAEWLAAHVSTPIVGVAGNWDRASAAFPLERVFAAEVPLYLTHGHRLQVNVTRQVVVERAKAHQAAIAVHGHTHLGFAGMVDDVLVINPGSLSQPRGNDTATFVILDVDATGPACKCQVHFLTTTGAAISETVFHTKK